MTGDVEHQKSSVEETSGENVWTVFMVITIFGGAGVALFGDGVHALAGAVLSVGMGALDEWHNRR